MKPAIANGMPARTPSRNVLVCLASEAPTAMPGHATKEGSCDTTWWCSGVGWPA